MRLVSDLPLLDNIKIVGVVLKRDSKDLKEFYSKIKQYFEKYNIKVLLDSTSANMIQVQDDNVFEFEILCQKSDFLLSIGGDGTLISTVRRSIKYDIPILGVNLGKLGFLTDINPNELETFIKKILNNQYRIDARMMIEISIGDKILIAFNDIVLRGKAISSMVTIDASINQSKFNSYFGDGLIISTPTGTTAYNLSCGGPIVFPLTEAIVVTPISPHSLTQRPLVLPCEFEVELKTTNTDGMVVIIDGQDSYEVGQNDAVTIKLFNQKAKLIHRQTRNYFEILSKKLNWGNIDDK